MNIKQNEKRGDKPAKRRRVYLHYFTFLTICVLISFLMLEITLRLFPNLITLNFLKEFPSKEVRTEIAKRKNFPTIDATYVLKRNDNGPTLRLWLPNYLYSNRFDQIDIKYGAFDDPIMEFYKLSKEFNFVPIILYVPSAYSSFTITEFKEPKQKELFKKFHIKQKNYLSKLASINKIKFIDTTLFILEYNNKGITHLPANVHLSPEVNMLIAEIISNNL